MKVRNLVAAVVTSIGLAAAAPASAVVVGGIDFGPLGNTAHIETATLAETFVNGVGQQLQGYGLVTTVNQDTSYCAGGGSCVLYYHFHNYTVQTFSPTAVTFTGGVVDVYYAAAPGPNLFSQNSAANVAFITGLQLWASFTGHSFFDPLNPIPPTQTLRADGTLTGATLTSTGSGQLDVTLGVGFAGVADYLNGNSIGDNLGGFADAVATTSGNNFVLNPFDVSSGLATGCSTGQAAPGAWCLQGTLDTRGATRLVPEPSPLALLGLGIIAMAWVRRRTTH